MAATLTTAKVFQSGNSQVVRLPKDVRFGTAEVDIFRRGNEVVLREKRPSLADVFDLLTELPDDMLGERDDPPPQEREGL